VSDRTALIVCSGGGARTDNLAGLDLGEDLLHFLLRPREGKIGRRLALVVRQHDVRTYGCVRSIQIKKEFRSPSVVKAHDTTIRR
jgi:hypothetical protein